MLLRKIKTVTKMNLEDLDDNEIEHLMHIVWFALDYDEKTHKMTDAERELANKLLDQLKQIVINNDKEVEI